MWKGANPRLEVETNRPMNGSPKTAPEIRSRSRRTNRRLSCQSVRPARFGAPRGPGVAGELLPRAAAGAGGRRGRGARGPPAARARHLTQGAGGGVGSVAGWLGGMGFDPYASNKVE